MTSGGSQEAAFTHDDPGTSDATWFADPVWDGVPVLHAADLVRGPVRRLVVVSAHPDDETLGVGGSIAALSGLGVEVVLVLATAGERSHPDSAVWGPAVLAEQRLVEWHAASRELAPGAQEVFVHLPDGDVAGHEDELVDALRPLVEADTLVLAPYRADGHPDHEAAGRAAHRVAAEAGAVCLEYPVWWWHWNHPARVHEHLLNRALVVEPGADAVHAKHRALDCYPSQVTGLGPGKEHGPVVTRAVWQRGRRTIEVLFGDGVSPASTAAPASPRNETFDAMYDEGDDPWGWEESWYEQRRRSVICALLLRPRYTHVLELGCGTGLLTRDLSPRAGAVEALDVSHRALEVARRRNLDNVTWHQSELPAGLPAGLFDLVVVSEVAYFLRPTELASLLRQVRSQMTEGAELVLADWARPTSGIPLDGPLVHEMVEQLAGLPRVASYRDDDVWVESWSASGTAASAEGLV